ncbi:MAG: sugar ABC transporter permease [Clostridia bacterium]|nr:sugar ABC transporter permease [Clostridia bacterium]
MNNLAKKLDQPTHGTYWKDLGRRFSRYKFMYVLILPAVLCALIFQYLPMGGLIMAFQDYDIIGGIGKSPFTGLANFKEILSMPKFLGAIKNTLVYSSVTIFLGTPFPIALAILFNELKQQKLKKIVQTVSYLPHFISWISVIGMFYAMFSINGTFNDIMAAIFGSGYERKNILCDPDSFLSIIFWSGQWKNIGWNSVVYLAAIAGIDPTMYEAAKVDGCNRLKQVFYITIPSIMPTIVICFIMGMSSLVNSNFEQVYGFQNVYTQEATEVINTLTYRQGILNGDYSMATAFGMMQGVVSFLLVVVSNAVVKKGTGMGIW